MPISYEEDAVFKQAVRGDTKAFNYFFQKSWGALQKPLISLTGSEKEASNFFVRGMTILWEHCTREGNPAPHNSNAYLYTICRNEWRLEKRQEQNKFYITDINSIHKEIADAETMTAEEVKYKEEQELFIERILAEAIDKISEKCKKIIELHINGKQRLREIWQSLGYKSYEAIVQAKYNCKKKLGDYIFLQLNKRKKMKKLW